MTHISTCHVTSHICQHATSRHTWIHHVTHPGNCRSHDAFLIVTTLHWPTPRHTHRTRMRQFKVRCILWATMPTWPIYMCDMTHTTPANLPPVISAHLTHLSHITRVNTSRHTCEWITSHIRKNRVRQLPLWATWHMCHVTHKSHSQIKAIWYHKYCRCAITNHKSHSQITWFVSRYTCEWITSHIWMRMACGSHVGHECVCESHITTSWYACEWITSHIWMHMACGSHVGHESVCESHIKTSWHACEWITSHIWMHTGCGSHVGHECVCE